MRRTLPAALAAMALAVLAGCSSTEALGRFTIISSKNVELGRLGEMTRHHEILQTDNKNLNLRVFWFVRARRVSQSYELENALDGVVEQIPGGIALVDAQLSYYRKRGFLNFTQRWGFIFEGTVLVDPRITGGQARLDELAPNGSLYAVSDGDTGEVTFVDEAAFNELVASVK